MYFLINPHTPDCKVEHYNDVEDTMDRAYTWLTTYQASRVLMVLLKIQTEHLLTKIPGKSVTTMLTIGSLSNLSRI